MVEKTVNEWLIVGNESLYRQNAIWISAGLVDGYSPVNKYGRNLDVDTTSTPEDMWGGGGLYTGFPLTDSEPVEVFSSDVADASAGTGLRTVVIQGLDQDWNAASETITLNGLTPVQSVRTYRRVNTMRGTTAGSGGFNVGTITVRHATTETNVFLVMLPNTNQTNCSAYTVPAGHTAFLMSSFGTLRGAVNGTADCTFAIRAFNGVFRYRRPFTISPNYEHNETIAIPIDIPEKTDIIIRCTAVSVSNLELSAGYDLTLVRNS
jgi:hypothetical protein